MIKKKTLADFGFDYQAYANYIEGVTLNKLPRFTSPNVLTSNLNDELIDSIFNKIYKISLSGKNLSKNEIIEIAYILLEANNLYSYIYEIDGFYKLSSVLASYDLNKKSIYFNMTAIDSLISTLSKNELLKSDLEMKLYQNLNTLKIILDEIEFANQMKNSFTSNSLDSFIIRLSLLTGVNHNSRLSKIKPETRLASIKSSKDLIDMFIRSEIKSNDLDYILRMEKLIYELNGYHYVNKVLNSPIVNFFSNTSGANLLEYFDWYKKGSTEVFLNYNLEERLKYGFPITDDEYKHEKSKTLRFIDKSYK